MHSSYFLRFLSPKMVSTAQGFVKASPNAYLNQNLKISPSVRNSIITYPSFRPINRYFTTGTGSDSPPKNYSFSTAFRWLNEWGGIGSLASAIIGIIMLYREIEKVKNNTADIQSSLQIKADVGLLSLKLSNTRDDEEKARFLLKANHEALLFARTGYHGFSETRNGKHNIVRDAVESLVMKKVKVKVVLPSKDLLPKLKKQPGLEDKDIERNVKETLSEIKKINEKYPHSPPIKVKLTKDILFVTAELIDPKDCDAKVVFIREIERHEKNALVFTFAKNLGEGIGYHETADKMIKIWKSLPAYDLESNNEYTNSSPSAFFQNKNGSSSVPTEETKISTSPTNGKK